MFLSAPRLYLAEAAIMTTETKSIEITQENNKANIVLDMSMFDLFSLCPCRYNIRHNLLKGPPIQQKSKSLDMGSLAHEGLEVYFKLLRDGINFKDRMQALTLKINTLAADPDVSNSEPEDVTHLINAVSRSCEIWRHEDEYFEILEVEQAFAYCLYEDEFVRIIITGKIDLLVNKRGMGNNASYEGLPLDHKTYQRDFEVPRLSNQFMNYCSAVGSNFIFVNRIPLHKNPDDELFKRIPLSYDAAMFESWRKNVTSIILNDYLTCIETGYWPQRFTSCFAWNRKCEAYEICEASGEEAKRIKLEDNFVTISPWDVTAKLVKN